MDDRVLVPEKVRGEALSDPCADVHAQRVQHGPECLYALPRVSHYSSASRPQFSISTIPSAILRASLWRGAAFGRLHRLQSAAANAPSAQPSHPPAHAPP